jgi:hypothetical protein
LGDNQTVTGTSQQSRTTTSNPCSQQSLLSSLFLFLFLQTQLHPFIFSFYLLF